MKEILQAICVQQSDNPDAIGDAKVTFVNGDSITGVIESTEGGIVSVTRRLGLSDSRSVEYADIPRHFAISAVVGVYYTEGS